MTPGALLDPLLRAPIYTQASAARIVGTSTSSLHRWAEGYERQTSAGFARNEPMITLARPGRGLTIPFVGLAEAFVLASFRRAGLPMQRIRPAVEALRNGMGIAHALASDRLVTDGAEILWRSQDGAADERLIVVRNNQAVFNEVVRDSLEGIKFEDGWAYGFALPQFRDVEVTVDPRVNGGRPSLARRHISVDDILGRLRAGEPVSSLAYDYYLEEREVTALLNVAA
jgi:uncharacterized protein (DUF433 family)